MAVQELLVPIEDVTPGLRLQMQSRLSRDYGGAMYRFRAPAAPGMESYTYSLSGFKVMRLFVLFGRL